MLSQALTQDLLTVIWYTFDWSAFAIIRKTPDKSELDIHILDPFIM